MAVTMVNIWKMRICMHQRFMPVQMTMLEAECYRNIVIALVFIVNLINTGSGAGVYWDVGSSATIDVNTTLYWEHSCAREHYYEHHCNRSLWQSIGEHGCHDITAKRSLWHLRQHSG